MQLAAINKMKIKKKQKNLLLVKIDGCKLVLDCSPEPKLFPYQHTALALSTCIVFTILNTTCFPSICLLNFCPFMAHQKGSFVLLGALQLQKLPPKLHYRVMAPKYTSSPPLGWTGLLSFFSVGPHRGLGLETICHQRRESRFHWTGQTNYTWYTPNGSPNNNRDVMTGPHSTAERIVSNIQFSLHCRDVILMLCPANG